MSALRRYLALFMVAALALGPVVADARPGGGTASIGSRGSRSYDSNPGMAPLQRSITPASPSQPATGPVWSTPGWRQPGVAAPSFWRSLTAGFVGAWVVQTLFGGWGYGGVHMGGMIVHLMLFALVLWVGHAVWRGLSGGPSIRPRAAYFGGGYAMPMGGYEPTPRPMQQGVRLDDRDFAAFGRILAGVQDAWSRGDIEGLRRVATAEMVAYFADMLANNASQGVVNRVEQVMLLHGEGREAWREGGVDYATCHLHWRAVDYTQRLDNPAVIVDGDPRRPVEVAEFWTFRRTAGGYWLLSAIQQGR